MSRLGLANHHDHGSGESSRLRPGQLSVPGPRPGRASDSDLSALPPRKGCPAAGRRRAGGRPGRERDFKFKRRCLSDLLPGVEHDSDSESVIAAAVPPLRLSESPSQPGPAASDSVSDAARCGHAGGPSDF